MKSLKCLISGALLLAVGCMAAATPKVIAHRGYWKTDGSAQNSIRSIVKADSIHCYASEFDVWMTSDSVLVVNHDPDINGVHIESSPAEVVLAQKLANGENVPTLESYLATASKLPSRIVCEMKQHNSRSHELATVKAILAMVKKYGLEDKVDYITFSRDGFKNFIKYAPKGTGVYYLDGDYVPEQIKQMGGAGIDYSLKAIKKHPEWIKGCHDLGLLVNIWTVNSEADMKWCIDHDVDFITTNEPELLQSLLKRK
ncbi:MAG: glycerophosphodiester phosphodiesterase [Bacteroides sp.]|nr:glycerophosphodiester phosphodiesterase [Bacteroides sp.]